MTITELKKYAERMNAQLSPNDPDCPCHQKGGEDENAF